MPRTDRAIPPVTAKAPPDILTAQPSNGLAASPYEVTQLLSALQAVRDGDFSVRLPGHWTGVEGKIADTFNDIVAANAKMADELERVGTVVGKQGRTRQRVKLPRSTGAWCAMQASINTLIDDLLWPMHEVTRALAAVARGDLEQTVRLDVEGRPLKGEFLRSATIVNTMILRARVSVFAELYRKTRALERLNEELEKRVAERTAALEASAAALKEADQRKDEFLAMLAHELRNPLAPIRTAVQLLRLKELAESQRARARDVIERQVEHLVDLINDLLDVSRITRGVIALQREPLLVGAIVARAVEIARPAIDAKQHELFIGLPDESLAVDGDRTRLVQVIANILHNAAKFMEPRGKIRLTVARDGMHAVIKISDTGIGIAPEMLPTIFELFTQAHSRVERTEGGLGIGLALIRRLTEMHGGTVTAYSEGPGRGTELTVRLPVLAAHLPADVHEPVATPALPELPSRRILVADDNDDAAESLTLRLQLAGHDVRTARNGAEALAIAGEFKPQIVLLDLGMPKMDGYATAREIRKRPWGKHATLIALTGWGQQKDRKRTAEAGFDRHLVKPVAEVELFEALAFEPPQANASSAAQIG